MVFAPTTAKGAKNFTGNRRRPPLPRLRSGLRFAPISDSFWVLDSLNQAWDQLNMDRLEIAADKRLRGCHQIPETLIPP
ncbi:MAG: hypothetical protein EA001_13235 [Oscillatoriales cyanobacterium]|nr:MAG: hypothetical protein EA001_13235 [Oscillatoriales cyanobacterium]